MQKQEDYLAQINEWEYCYCGDCGKIRYRYDLEATERGIKCSKCGGYNLEAPDWVQCPHRKVTSVKCPRGGRGIKKEKYGYECEFRCNFF